ncbi:hypothetical protein COCON_G00062890 [Conger conger]|uniref:Reverse transcriptase RNase H-like domain-containing protein n=1 Tax=Conger conger TaxID=82655 RepID=A0A9Q1DRN7_CONCO|nr:hypothetical protein COCON_G00062890 [Conger conger]
MDSLHGEAVGCCELHVRIPATGIQAGGEDQPGGFFKATARKIKTDTLDKGLGVVSSQEVEGEERPVSTLHQQKLSPRESWYSTIEKECLAIKCSVLTLRYNLLGKHFDLYSDHAPLHWLHRMKDTNAWM